MLAEGTECNGYDVAKQICQQPWGKTAFLVALSGFGSKEDRKRGLEAGFDTYLPKPVSRAQMTAVLAAYSNRNSLSTARSS